MFDIFFYTKQNNAFFKKKSIMVKLVCHNIKYHQIIIGLQRFAFYYKESLNLQKQQTINLTKNNSYLRRHSQNKLLLIIMQ